MFDTFEVIENVQGEEVALNVFYTDGADDLSQLRPLTYLNADVFLVLYSVCVRRSFLNVEKKWIAEIRQGNPNVPIVLGARKTDLRDNARLVRSICSFHVT